MNAENAATVKGWLQTLDWMKGMTPVEYTDARGDISLKVLFPLAELDFLMAGLSNWGVGTYPLTDGTDGPFGEVLDARSMWSHSWPDPGSRSLYLVPVDPFHSV